MIHDAFTVQNCLKQGNPLSTPLYQFALEYATGKFQANQEELKLREPSQFLVCTDYVNLLSENKEEHISFINHKYGRLLRSRYSGTVNYFVTRMRSKTQTLKNPLKMSLNSYT
jgi:hypothetical protein